MTNDEIFSVWLPGDSPWSTWGKPVLFAHLDAAFSWQPVPGRFLDVTGYPSAVEKVALVLDLPGV